MKARKGFILLQAIYRMKRQRQVFIKVIKVSYLLLTAEFLMLSGQFVDVHVSFMSGS